MNMPPGHSPDLSLDQIVELERRAHERELAEAVGDAHDGPFEPGVPPIDSPPNVLPPIVLPPIVLPWWQRPFNIVTILVTAALLAGMIGFMVGDSLARVQYNENDVGFLQDMREHHEQAIEMGFIFRELPDTNNGLAVIAASIIQGQAVEVGRMIQFLRTFGEDEAGDGMSSMQWMGMEGMEMTPQEMPGMATPEQLDELLSSSGRAADELFVQLMTAHHEGGIDMAEYAAIHAGNDQVRRMATSMADSQRHEIAEMAGRLAP